MRLNSSRGRKTSFNMTCKTMMRGMLGACLALLAAIAPARSRAADEPARTLLVYDARNPAMDETDVERFCTLMTAMGKDLDFGDIRDCKDALGAYDYVVCYRMEAIGEDELRAVCDYGGELLIMGGDLMKRTLTRMGRADKILLESELDRGVLRYSFFGEEPFEAIVEAENIALFESEEESEGALTAQGQTCPFFSRIAGMRFTPVTSLASPLAQAALAQELTGWMWPYRNAPPDYGQYLVLDEIYPFMDAQTLLEQIDALIGEDIPYVLSVAPIYENTSYPAMVQFCQVLRYAQANGGFILIRAPIVQAVRRDGEALRRALTQGLRAYTDNGVYPLGFEVPVSWTNDGFYLDALARYRTVFVRDDGGESGFSLDAGHSALHDGGHQLVMPALALDGTGASQLTCYPSAIYLDADKTDAEQIRALVRQLKGRRVPFQSLWTLGHAVWGDDLSLLYDGERLTLDGEAVSLAFEPEAFDEAYDYNRDIVSRITISLQRQNRYLTAATAVIVAAFAGFMIYLRRANRRSFFF